MTCCEDAEKDGVRRAETKEMEKEVNKEKMTLVRIGMETGDVKETKTEEAVKIEVIRLRVEHRKC